MKFIFLSLVIFSLLSCSKEKSFENESYIADRSISEKINKLESSDLSSTKKVKQILSLLDHGHLAQKLALKKINNIISVDFDHQSIPKIETLKTLTDISNIVSLSSISNLELFTSMLGEDSGSFENMENIVSELSSKNTQSHIKAFLLTKYFEKREVKINSNILKSLFQIFESKVGVWQLSLNDSEVNSLYLRMLSSIPELHKGGLLPVSRLTLKSTLNFTKDLIKQKNVLEKVSICYDFLDYYFNYNVSKFDADLRNSFNQWQIHIESKLKQLVASLHQQNFPANPENFNPQIEMKFHQIDLEKKYQQRFLVFTKSPFMKMFYQVKQLRSSDLSSANSLSRLRALTTKSLKEFYQDENFRFKIKEFAKDSNLDTLTLTPGIFYSEQNQVINFNKIYFSPLSVIYSPGLKLIIDSEELTSPWIDVSGKDSLLNEKERDTDPGEIPHMEFFHIPDPAHGNPIATVRGIREHNTAPRDFSPCVFEGRNTGWMCIVKMVYEFTGARIPGQQKKGADGENGGHLILKNLKKVNGKGIIAANGGSGSKGHQGQNSPLCQFQGGVTNYKPLKNMKSYQWFTCMSKRGCKKQELFKGFHPFIKDSFSYTEYEEPKVDSEEPLIHISRGRSGDGGSAGNGGLIEFDQSPSFQNLVLFVGPGTPGEGGEVAPCGPRDDLSNQNRNLIMGNNGSSADKGEITY